MNMLDPNYEGLIFTINPLPAWEQSNEMSDYFRRACYYEQNKHHWNNPPTFYYAW